jgi:predicted flap endonuclease-1-like 5' DNA nuclease
MRHSPPRTAQVRRFPWYGWCGAATLLAGQVGVLLDVVSVRTIFYCIAWWSYIFAADAWVWKRRGNSLLRSRPREFWFLAFWSVPVWNLFELANFRLQNWFYINIPADLTLALVLNFTAYATVLPGIFETYELLTVNRVGERARVPALRVTPLLLVGSAVLGASMLFAALVWPRFAFPLIWGCAVFLGDPLCYRMAAVRRHSLLGQLERGDPRPFLRLMLAGLLCGGLWEFWNFWAYTKWLYTVPYFEHLKWFEMPPLGFLGFPPFALECYVLVNLLNAPRRGRMWETWDGTGSGAPRWLAICATSVALVFNAFVYAGIETLTVKSVAPKLADIEGVSEAIASALGQSGVTTPPRLLRRTATPEDRATLARASGLGLETLTAVRQAALLVDLKGLGAANYNALRRLGIGTVEELARQDAGALFPRWHEAVPRMQPTLSQVRLWVRAARRAADLPAGTATTNWPHGRTGAL